MTYDDFDITFCNGKVDFSENGVMKTKECPMREKCHRFWTETHTKEAERLRMRYHSFFMLTDPNDITENGCKNFWSKK